VYTILISAMCAICTDHLTFLLQFKISWCSSDVWSCLRIKCDTFQLYSNALFNPYLNACKTHFRPGILNLLRCRDTSILLIDRTSWSCFVFGRARIQTSARRPAILFLVVFLSPFRQVLG
jgi:hypothetical protein